MLADARKSEAVLLGSVLSKRTEPMPVIAPRKWKASETDVTPNKIVKDTMRKVLVEFEKKMEWDGMRSNQVVAEDGYVM